MGLPTIIGRHGGTLLLLGIFLLGPASLSGAAEKMVANPAPARPPMAGGQLMLEKNDPPTQSSPPLTHQTPSSGQNTGNRQNAATCNPIKIDTPLTLPSGTVDRPYAMSIVASGGFPPMRYALMKGAVLPPGLQLDSRGRISGTPAAPGRYRFGIMVYDRCPAAVQAEERHFFLSVFGAASAPLQQNQTETLHRPVPNRHSAVFHIEGLHLLFEERGTSIVVKPNTVLPRLVAQIRLQGEGVVRGYWQVDNGPAHPYVRRVKGPLAVLAFPDQTKLPTTKPGRHDVRFVIADPDTAIPEGRASYRIMPAGIGADDQTRRQILVTVTPENGSRVVERLRTAYMLRQVDAFDIRSLGLRTVVFASDGDIPAQLKAIRQERDVIQADRNQVFQTFGDPKSGLQQIAASFNFDVLHARSRGRGVRVAVIDTGVDGEHGDLKDRVTSNVNLVADSPFRAEIHGTAVAGIIGASINGFGIEGVAPGVELLALRACRQISPVQPGGRGDTVALVKALDMALIKKAKVVNMSFGAPRPDRLVEMLLAKGTAQGVLFVAPVGNEQGMKSAWFPASSRLVVAVGGRDAKGRPYPDAHADPFARVCAPAENILTTTPGDRFNFLSGTSMSSAIVTGLLALVAEQHPHIDLDGLPPFEDRACRWLEQLMDVRICEP